MTAWKLAHTVEDGRTAGDRLRAVATEDGVTVSIEQSWIGVTETGSGATCSLRMTPVAARNFALWLIEAAEQAEG